MKKLLCIFFALLFILGMAHPQRASASINYCRDFEDAINLLRWNSPYWDIADGEAFPVSSIINYTKQQLICDEYGEEPVTEGDYTYFARYAIPADVFEAAAKDFFAVVDVNALRSYTSFFWDSANFTGIDDFQNYREDRGVYLFSNSGGMGDPSWYEVLGYTEEDGRYRVYSRFVSLLWEEPEGVEGVDYIQIDGEFFAIDHYLETILSISNGRVQFHTWDERTDAPAEELTPPMDVVAQQEGITIEAPTGAFPADTSFAVAPPEGEAAELITGALDGVAANFVAFDISANQPMNGSLQVMFAIPEGFDRENLALFCILEDGTLQQLEMVMNPDNGTITAELSSFGLYALTELITFEPQLGDTNGDGKINTRDARLILQYIVGLIGEEDLSLTLADFNGDGNINARDARMLLQHIAGL